MNVSAAIRRLILLTLAVGVLCLAPLAFACDPRVSFADSVRLSPARGFGLDTSPPIVSPARIELTGSASSCSVILGFSSRSDTIGEHYMTNGQNRIAYRLQSRPNVSEALGDLPSTSRSSLLHGLVVANEPVVFQFYVAVPGHQKVPPGTYRDRLEVTAYDANDPTSTPLTVRSVEVSMTVNPDIDLKILSGTGSGAGADSHAIDFGELQSFEEADIRLKVSSNVTFQILVMSESGGYFSNVSRPQATIPYTIRLGESGESATLQQPVSLTVVPRTTTHISQIPMTVTVGAVEQSLAGLYRDRMLITVQAL